MNIMIWFFWQQELSEVDELHFIKKYQFNLHSVFIDLTKIPFFILPILFDLRYTFLPKKVITFL